MKIAERINDPQDFDLEYIDKELKNGKHVIVQVSEKTYTDNHLAIINELCKKYSSDFGVRFFGHYSNSFDCKTLLTIPDVKCLYVDCLTKADNPSAIHDLNKLEKISVGITELKESDILNGSNLKTVTELTLIGSKIKSVDLKYLSQYKRLKRLRIAEFTKNIDAIGEIPDLEHLSLSSIKKTPIGFVNKLKKLKNLEIALGGRDNIHEIDENEIESLSIDWVRGFNDISNISKFKKLRSLSIERIIQLTKVHFDEQLKDLKTLWIIDCKSLKSLTGLEKLDSLEHLRVSRTSVDINEILNQKLPTTLEIFAFYTWKNKIDKEIRLTLDKNGYKEWRK